MISLFAALFARLWFLQVMTAPEYQVAAENNRVRVVQVEAPRGRILDRNGNELVTNRRSIVITVDWQRYNRLERPAQLGLLRRLSQVLTLDADPTSGGCAPCGRPRRADVVHHRRPGRDGELHDDRAPGVDHHDDCAGRHRA